MRLKWWDRTPTQLSCGHIIGFKQVYYKVEKKPNFMELLDMEDMLNYCPKCYNKLIPKKKKPKIAKTLEIFPDYVEGS